MMNISFTIAGIDRTSDIMIDWSVEQVLTNEEDACSFVVVAGDKPFTGEEIVVRNDNKKLFAGIIDVVKEDAKTGQLTFFNCSARDYSYMIDRRLVVETYVDQRADAIFRDIVAKYAHGFTVNNVNANAPYIERMAFNYKRPSDCFKELCDYVGWDWYVDYDKDLHFFNPTELAEQAPIFVNSGSKIRKIKHNIDTATLRNRIFVNGGTMMSDFQTLQWKADGVARTWLLPWEPNEASLKVGEAAKTIGIENVDNESECAYLLNLKDKYLKASTATPTTLSGTTMELRAKQAIDVITVVEDLGSQEAIAAIQGGDGVYEHMIDDDSLCTVEAGEAAGTADLLQHANPRVKGSFETEIEGWSPGQLLRIELPERGINGTFLIQKVSIGSASPDYLTYKVEYGGRLMGIADFLKAMLSAQQSKKGNDTRLMHKYVYGKDQAGVADELLTSLGSLPYICGSTEAICGLVVVSN